VSLDQLSINPPLHRSLVFSWIGNNTVLRRLQLRQDKHCLPKTYIWESLPLKPMSEEPQQNWHQKPLVRLLLLLLLPAILFGLYMASNWLAFRKAPSVPIAPETSPTTG
jgi:hypothetical protein